MLPTAPDPKNDPAPELSPEAEAAERERERIRTLRDLLLLDTSPERTFDILTKHAAEMCGTSHSALTLVDTDRQWIKSLHGSQFGVSEVPRAGSFSERAAASGSLFVVPDASLDPRFADTAFVTGEPHIRFYAGMPIFSPEHHVLGVLSVFDGKPSEITAQQQAVLEDLTSLAEELFQGRRGVVELTNELVRRQSIEQRYSHESMHDPLTDLPNRLLFRDRLEHAVESMTHEKRPLILLIVALDHFRQVNDQLGHSAGDELLRQLAGRLRDELRGIDTIARISGDEFALILNDIRTLDGVAAVSRKVRAAIEAPLELAGRTYSARASAGIARFPEDSKDAEGLIRAADTALDLAKEEGGHHHVFFQPEMLHATAERLRLDQELMRAVVEQQFLMHYQPVIDLHSGKTVAAESLIRWNHPRRGLTFPGEFIAHVETSDELVHPVGNLVLRMSCIQARAWQDAGFPVKVAVNLAAPQFQHPHFISTIEAILAETGLSASKLDFEITERVALQNIDLTKRVIGELSALDIGVSIDDFGVDQSSISMLKHLPVDTVKIDQSFLRELNRDDPQEIAFLRAIIDLCKARDLRVVAEGVETAGQLEVVREMGCDLAQGYFFSRPVPKEQMQALLRGPDLGRA